jgi:hypothetical protein
LRVQRLLRAGLALLVLPVAPTALAAGGVVGVSRAAISPGTTGGQGAETSPGTEGSDTGGAGMTGSGGETWPAQPLSTPSRPTVPGEVAKIVHGLAYAPADAPMQVKKAIWAGDAIRHKRYVFGGGHGTWGDTGYDCSGSVSYVLHAAGLLKISMDSSGFETWGLRGLGQWITVYTNAGHAFVQIAGIRLDTSAEQDPDPPAGTGPRWRPLMRSTSGYRARHPASL